MKEKIRTYSELIRLRTFDERFEYLKLNGTIGEETFGFDRYFNQRFYKSKEWADIRRYVLIRDKGCDLGVLDHEIPDGVMIFVHHINPISIDDIRHSTDYLLNPEYLISVTKLTHDAIHYGDKTLLPSGPAIRTPYDMCPWKIG